MRLAEQGDLTNAQVKEVIAIVNEYRKKMLRQWELFKHGKSVRIIKVKK